MARTILHLDLDAFFCAVEEGLNPTLRGHAFAVGGRPEERGVVASCSYPARRFGVRSAMPMGEALRLCPNLLIVPSNFKAYRTASREVMSRLQAFTPLIEQISIDEAFLDVTGTPGGGEALARRLQAMMRDELHLPCSFGVASNKLLAKIANNIGKASAHTDAPPNAITVVQPGDEAAFLAPLPVQELWGVGPKTAQKFKQMGINTIGDLARRSDAEMARIFGKNGVDMLRHARGIDDRPVQTEHEAKSISREITYARNVRDGDVLRRSVIELAEGVGWRLRRAGLSGTTVKIKLRWADFTTLTRQTTFPQPVNSDDEIRAAALALFEQHWPQGRPVRLIGVGVSGLDEHGRQLGLWETPQNAQSERLQSTLDELRERFGEQIIKRGSQIDQKRNRKRD